MSGIPMPRLAPPTVAAAVAAASTRLSPYLLQTPVVPSPWLSRRTGAEVQLKLENLQHTGSFKLRGALHALLQLTPAQREAGVVAASSGNHGLGLAAAGAMLGIAVEVWVPESTVAAKRQAIRDCGAAVSVHGDDCLATEAHARWLASSTGRHYVSPYNDLDVLAGQGTVMVEILQQWPAVELVYVAVGGGGLLAGMAAYAAVHRPDVELVACSPAASPALAECVAAGGYVDAVTSPTWSDSTAGGLEPGSVTLPLCQSLVARWPRLGEAAIADAMRAALQHQHLLVEGAAGVALAACLADAERRQRRALVLVCGGNLPLDRLRELLQD